MNATRKQARIAGLLYLLASITAVFVWIYVPSKLIVKGDATATANHIRDSETLFRLGVGTELTGLVIFVFVVLALYRLFKPVSEQNALGMAVLLWISLPISFVGVVHEMAALIVAGRPSFLSALDQPHLDSLSYLFLRLHAQGIIVAQIFWGLWLFPFGTLVIRSGFIPRFLGYLLFIAAIGNIASSVASLLPDAAPFLDPVARKLALGELPIIFWLLIWGAKDQGFARQSIPAGGSSTVSR
jgi:hypothetical protein